MRDSPLARQKTTYNPQTKKPPLKTPGPYLNKTAPTPPFTHPNYNTATPPHPQDNSIA